jgi:hypothetical protein
MIGEIIYLFENQKKIFLVFLKFYLKSPFKNLRTIGSDCEHTTTERPTTNDLERMRSNNETNPAGLHVTFIIL